MRALVSIHIGAPNKGGNGVEEIELIKAIQEGDMHAFEILFNRYKTIAYRTVYLMIGDEMSTEDIVQEVFVICYLELKKLKHPEYFKTWFYRVLTRQAWRYAKKETKLIPTEQIDVMVEQHTQQSYKIAEGQKDMEEVLYQAIMQLDYKVQTTLVLYYYNDFSIKEIAKVMGCLEGTVKSRLHTGRKKLKVYLESEQYQMQLSEV